MIEFPAEARIYVDTNIWIYFLEGHAAFAPRVRALFVAASNASCLLCTSEMTIAECLLKPSRDGDVRKIAAYDALFGGGTIRILPMNGALARRAAIDGGALGLKLIDAIHYVTAREAGCGYFLSADGRFKSQSAMTVLGLA